MSEWIAWNGGKRPVDRDCRVDIKYREDDTSCNCTPSGLTAKNYAWLHDGGDDDIIAYRILSQQGAEDKAIADGWIKCSDRMPDFMLPVLVTDGVLVAMSARSKLEQVGRDPWQVTYSSGNQFETPGKITHWQPLPAPPGE